MKLKVPNQELKIKLGVRSEELKITLHLTTDNSCRDAINRVSTHNS
ncbi:hypothetical protein [Nostoc sp.]